MKNGGTGSQFARVTSKVSRQDFDESEVERMIEGFGATKRLRAERLSRAVRKQNKRLERKKHPTPIPRRRRERSS